MNETKHTPGPWEIRRTGHDAKDFSIFEEGIASSSGCIAKLPYRDGRECLVLANSRLIAAAPDLLAALIEAADMLDVAEFPEGVDCVRRVRAAIAKAGWRAQA